MTRLDTSKYPVLKKISWAHMTYCVLYTRFYFSPTKMTS